jgi:WD40 repeat protein
VNDGMDWSKLDRVQVLGTGRADDGHTGYVRSPDFYDRYCDRCELTSRCVNALSWSVDGDILLSGSDDKRYVHLHLVADG